MKPVHIIGGTLVLGGLAWAAHNQWKARQNAANAAPAQAAPELTAAVGVAPPAQQAAQEAQGSKLPKLPSGVGTAAAVAVAGIKLQNALGDIAERVGGEGAGNVARVGGPLLGAATIVGKGVQIGLQEIGVANEPSRVAGLVTGVAVVAGAPVAAGALVAQLAGSALQEGLKAVAGEKVERAVSNAVSQLDPFKPGSLANKAVEPVADVVSWAGDILGGKSEAQKQREAQEQQQAAQWAAEVLSSNPTAAQQVASVVGKPSSLLQTVKAVAPPAPPAPAPSPPFVPARVATLLPGVKAPPPAAPPVVATPAVAAAPPPVDTAGRGKKVKLGGLSFEL